MSARDCAIIILNRKGMPPTEYMSIDSLEKAISALTYSIVETAKANGVDVYYYLKYLLMKCPTSLTCDEELEKLCPWNHECKEALDELHRQHQKAIFDAM